MLKLYTVVLTLTLFYVLVYGQKTNDQWKRCEKVVKTYDMLYDNLALTVEDSSDRQKRSFSILIDGVLNYLATSGDITVTVDVSLPADVIAGDTRSQLGVGRSVLDPSINMVKRACPPKATEQQCLESLAEEEEEETKKCSGFPEQLKFYKLTEKVFSDKDVVKIMNGLVIFSYVFTTDKSTLGYLDDIKYGRVYKEGSAKLMKWYAEYAKGHFTCNLPPVDCDTNIADNYNAEYQNIFF